MTLEEATAKANDTFNNVKGKTFTLKHYIRFYDGDDYKDKKLKTPLRVKITDLDIGTAGNVVDPYYTVEILDPSPLKEHQDPLLYGPSIGYDDQTGNDYPGDLDNLTPETGP